MAVGVIFDMVLYSVQHNYLHSSCMEVLTSIVFRTYPLWWISSNFFAFFTYYFASERPSLCSQAQDIGCLTTSKIVFQSLTGFLIWCLAHCTKKYICRINYKCRRSSSFIKLLLKGLRNPMVIEKQNSDC